ncbi:MAG TPA: PD-(D/E)XK nuclease family protein, partial [Solirubrobacterales bacterium]|nr:PD-(D/E)XK nuclease family protein [Solirubrobacterales bacterium]
PSAREERAAHGAAVHALLEWSQTHGWAEPSPELARRHAVAAGLCGSRGGTGSSGSAEGKIDAEALLTPVRGWLGSRLRRERIDADGARVRAEAPLLLGIGDTVLRGSIDLLVERGGEPPLVVDYKTDRLGADDPAGRAADYEVQRTIYALAVAEASGAEEVEVAYVFLERPDEPVLTRLGPEEMTAGRERLAASIARIGVGEFPAAPPEDRSWDLCGGCPALGRLCAGPRRLETGGEVV